MLKKLETADAPAAIGPYSQGWRAGDFVFTSGQIGVDPAVGTAPEGIEAQAEQACRNVAAVLRAADASVDQVVKTTCFLADMADFKAFNAVYEKHFTSEPARSCVAVKTLPLGLLCEIEAVAYVGE